MRGKRQEGKKPRWMKVLYATRRKKEGPLQEAFYMQYPKISMEGEWLEELGFHIGDRLFLECGYGYINIRPVETGAQAAMVCEPSDGYASRKNMEGVQGSPDGKAV